MPTATGQIEAHPVTFYAERYDLSVRTIWRAIASGDLKCYHIGRAVRVTPEQWRAYIERGEAR